MARISHCLCAPMMSLLLAASLSLVSVSVAAAPYSGPAQSATASQQDKAKACNDSADKKGLQGQDRKTFMQNCLNNMANSGSGGNVSQQDKSTACKNLADKKDLQGNDRRSFMKDCMKKANP
jgi:hypothetical protein